ncbi:MAG: Ca-activated chloride channel [Solirubrobacteraceae bacterium]|jgi:Ca-activated chloride channel family protein|nr:Ca-activated chloride channel [Solirubrobacteraceae bacterium]
MTLQAPLFLLALLLVPLAVVAYVRREGRGRAAFASPAMLPSVAPRAPAWRRHAPLVAYAVALIALIFALARPQVATSVPVEQARIILVTDQSGSMAAQDVKPTRLDAAVAAEKNLIRRAPHQVQIAAITYNKIARVIQGPTTDRDALISAIDTIRVKGTTATGEAIETALKTARSGPVGTRPPPAAIVLLSDGKSVAGKTDPITAAQDAAKAKIPVYTVALGTPGGFVAKRNALGTVIGRTNVPPDPETLKRIAEISKGEAFAVSDSDKLSAIYKRLGSQLTRKKAHKQITAGFAGGGLALILLGAGMSLFWFGRVP